MSPAAHGNPKHTYRHTRTRYRRVPPRVLLPPLESPQVVGRGWRTMLLVAARPNPAHRWACDRCTGTGRLRRLHVVLMLT